MHWRPGLHFGSRWELGEKGRKSEEGKRRNRMAWDLT